MYSQLNTKITILPVIIFLPTMHPLTIKTNISSFYPTVSKFGPSEKKKYALRNNYYAFSLDRRKLNIGQHFDQDFK